MVRKEASKIRNQEEQGQKKALARLKRRVARFEKRNKVRKRGGKVRKKSNPIF